MVQWFAKYAAPIVILAMGASLSGCGVMPMNWNEVDGVPLAELDMSGDAPGEILLFGPDNLIITEGDGMAITVDGNDEAGDALRFDRDGDSLTIARDSNVYDGSSNATVRLTIPAPQSLAIAGSGTITSASLANNAEIEIAGSGKITVAAVDADELDVDIAGSGEVFAAGTARKLSVEIAGSGNVRMGELMADEVSIDIAGSGNVELASDGTVEAQIAGSGRINVIGSATCSVESAGSGKLTCSPAPATAAAASAAPQAGGPDAMTSEDEVTD